jgi:catechol 2,3-dioxygenase-like lactoylglutathione lyase family enzyme
MRVHHVAMRTSDLGRLEAFYVEVLGFAVVRRSERSVWLDAEGTLLMLERADDGEPGILPGTKELIAFGIPPEACEDRVRRLRAAGVTVQHETAYTAYFRDPDGRRVALSHYPDRCGIAGEHT